MKGEIKLHGFVSRPEIQKLNRNSIFIFVNGRLIRDRVVQHALTEAYRNIIPPTVFPVVLLFLEMPFTEVDVNVHPSKTEVRFRQSSVLHDFIRDSVRAVLMKSRPVPAFMTEIHAGADRLAIADAGRARLRPQRTAGHRSRRGIRACARRRFRRSPRRCSLKAADSRSKANAAIPVARFGPQTFGGPVAARDAGSERQRLLAGTAGRRCSCRTGVAGIA